MSVERAQVEVGPDEFVLWWEEFRLRAEERKRIPGAVIDDDDDF